MVLVVYISGERYEKHAYGEEESGRLPHQEEIHYSMFHFVLHLSSLNLLIPSLFSFNHLLGLTLQA